MAGSFLGMVYYIGKVFQKLAPTKETFGLVFFGLSPLVVIETLVSGHLDIVMFFFAIFAFYQLLQKRYVWAFLLLVLSIGIKFVTVFLVPIFITVFILQIRKKDIDWSKIFICAIILLTITVFLASYRTTFQPWYLIAPLSFAVFYGYRYFVFIPSFILSFVALLTYVPFLYTGNWDWPIPFYLLSMYAIGVCLALLVTLVFRQTKPMKNKS